MEFNLFPLNSLIKYVGLPVHTILSKLIISELLIIFKLFRSHFGLMFDFFIIFIFFEYCFSKFSKKVLNPFFGNIDFVTNLSSSFFLGIAYKSSNNLLLLLNSLILSI